MTAKPHEASRPLTSLDPLDINADPLPPSIPFVHRGWCRQRAKTQSALDSLPSLSKRAERFRNCGTHAHVLVDQDDPYHYSLVGNWCGDPFCIPCARQRQIVISDNLQRHAPPGPYRLLTLTVTSSHHLPSTLTRLDDAWKRLKQSKQWSKHVTGGIAILEITHSTQHGWHPHLHCILTGSFWPLQELSLLWTRCTRQVVANLDISLINELRSVLAYVTAYCTKMISRSITVDPQLLPQAIHALHGRRFITTLGKWRGLRLLQPPVSTTDWEYLGPLWWLQAVAKEGNTVAQTHLDRILAQQYEENLLEVLDIDEKARPPPPQLLQLLFNFQVPETLLQGSTTDLHT